MISCGLQCINCDYPVHMDTYVGCTHNCKYCYKTARSNHIARNFNDIKPLNSVKGVKDFINGKRNLETMCFDWDIPLHWGANSDPFQECEKEFHASLDVLKVFAETLSKHVTRVVARVQLYFVDCKKEIIAELPNMAKAGIHGIIIQGYISNKKRKGMEKVGMKYRFPIGRLARDYKQIKEECHKVGLAFTCTEYGLDWLSDDLKCCGTAGLDQYKPNNFTLARLCYTPELAIPNETMMQKGTTRPFKSVRMTQAWALELKNKSYYDMIMSYEPSNTAYCLEKKRKYE